MPATILNQIRKDPGRKLIVVDPRRSETAEMADLHLAVRPGADAFLLGALLATAGPVTAPSTMTSSASTRSALPK